MPSPTIHAEIQDALLASTKMLGSVLRHGEKHPFNQDFREYMALQVKYNRRLLEEVGIPREGNDGK